MCASDIVRACHAPRVAARRRRTAALSLLVLWSLTSVSALAQDKATERATRRLQLQLQNLQQQVQEAQSAKAKVEADKAVSDKQLAEQAQQLNGLKGSVGKTQSSLRAAEAARAELAAKLEATQVAYAKEAAEQKRVNADTLAAKNREIAQLTSLRDGQVAELQRQRDAQATQVSECGAKNERLIQVGSELLGRYRNKTVADVLAQKDPLLGLGDVRTFNLIQEFRDKLDAERLSPSANR